MSRFGLPMLRFNSHASQSKYGISMEELDDMMKVREKCKHFRVLIIGRANAGKTTILQKICNTSEEARIQDAKGKLVPLSTVSPSDKRGLHNIEQELVFPTNPGFVFHDSRGIEAGGKDELDIVKQFIANRASAKKLEDRIHVIWYCIPVDNDRIFTAAEKSFFDNLGDFGEGKHKTPVIAIFTKFDHRDIEAFAAYQQDGFDDDDALRKAPVLAKATFEKEYLPMIYECNHPPQSHVYLRDMHENESSISELAERTAEVLESTILKLVFVSTQRSSIVLCTKYAIKQIIARWCIDHRKQSYRGLAPLLNQHDLYRLACHILVWYPYDIANVGEKGEIDEMKKYGGYGLGNQATDLKADLEQLAGPHPATNRILRLGTALCIIAEHSYSYAFRRRLTQATKVYLKSPTPRVVDSAVTKLMDNKTSDDSLAPALIELVLKNSLGQSVSSPNGLYSI